MHKNTFIMFDSGPGIEGLIEPNSTVNLIAKTQVPIRPHRLRIEPEIASFFMIEEVRSGTLSLFPTSQRVPASQFSIGLGDELDAGDVYPGIELLIRVTNASHLVPGGPLGPCGAHRDPKCQQKLCLSDPRRLGVPLPFRATWSAIVIPRVRLASSDLQIGEYAGYESLGTRIERVQETAGSPPVIRRELPGFGWDPYGAD
jgi:hypothetical protein